MRLHGIVEWVAAIPDDRVAEAVEIGDVVAKVALVFLQRARLHVKDPQLGRFEAGQYDKIKSFLEDPESWSSSRATAVRR